ncbi:MAG: DUF5666 domain-containing protein, partial [Fimbriimonadaceae bacterium]|nr:DUF5666 domain-containing protein [Fimbriimonadaceae bacterium]
MLMLNVQLPARSVRVAWFTLAATLAVGAALSGCGGSSDTSSTGGGTPPPPAGTSPVTLFVTDAVNDYAQVWVRVYGVRLVRESGETITLLDDGTGFLTDLRGLNVGGERRFSFVATGNVPRTRYRRAEVITDRDVRLVDSAGTSTVKRFAADFNLETNRSRIPCELNFDLAAPTDVIVDFDLANWTETATTITPVLARVDDPGLNNGDRHRREDYRGVVSGLSGTSPNQTFLLTGRAGRVNVSTSATTVIYRESGAGNPTLVNAQRVEVYGRLNPATRQLVANRIKIEDEGLPAEPQAYGAMSNLNISAGTLTLAIQRAAFFTPSGSTVNIVTTDATKYRLRRGIAATRLEFFEAATDGGFAEVEGSYNAATNTITARKLKLEGAPDGPAGEAEVKGTPEAIAPAANTFKIKMNEWEGFSGALGRLISIDTSAATFRGPGGL